MLGLGNSVELICDQLHYGMIPTAVNFGVTVVVVLWLPVYCSGPFPEALLPCVKYTLRNMPDIYIL